MADRMETQQRFALTERHPDDVIAYRADAAIPVRQLLAEASALSTLLRHKRYVINLHTDRYAYLRAFCAAVITGQCTLMPPNRQPQTISELKSHYADSYVYDPSCEDGIADAMPGTDLPIPAISATQLCAIAFTSGSTGTPKANPKYWETIRSGSLSNRRLLLRDRKQLVNMVATVPSQHMWGFETSVLLPLFSNVAISYQSPFFPQDIADALASLPSPRLLVSSPVHLEALLKSGVKLPRIETVYTATAPLGRDLASKLEEEFAANVLDIFGCSEAGILAVRKTSSDELWTLSKVFGFRIRDDGVEISASHLPETVVMPDIVELKGGHQFRLIGRQQDMVNIAGKRGSLNDLNQRLRSIPGVNDGVIFMPADDSNRLAALVVAPQVSSSDILNALALQVEPLFLPRPIVHVSNLPRQETGKLPLGAVRRMFTESRQPGDTE